MVNMQRRWFRIAASFVKLAPFGLFLFFSFPPSLGSIKDPDVLVNCLRGLIALQVVGVVCKVQKEGRGRRRVMEFRSGKAARRSGSRGGWEPSRAEPSSEKVQPHGIRQMRGRKEEKRGAEKEFERWGSERGGKLVRRNPFREGPRWITLLLKPAVVAK